MRLTQKVIKTLGPGRYSDSTCKTLQLLVTRTGGRSWVQRLVVDGRRLDRGLGAVEFVTLAEARETAARNRFAARRGGQPFTAIKREAAPTIADAVIATLDANRDRWSAASMKSWQGTMRRYVLPRLGSRRVNTLTRQDVIDTLSAITSVSEARKAKQRIVAVLELALSREWVDSNCAANGGLDASLPRLKRQNNEHHAAAPYGEVAGILAGVDSGSSGDAVKACIRFVVLTAVRSVEARKAQWDEFDLDAATWTIPADRMKTRREHRVPLSDAALAILRERTGLHKRYVFASDRTGRPMSAEGLSRCIKDSGATVHGFRSSFRDWAGETGQDREAAEHALSHVVGSTVERSYARSDLFDRRRALLDKWADYLTA